MSNPVTILINLILLHIVFVQLFGLFVHITRFNTGQYHI